VIGVLSLTIVESIVAYFQSTVILQDSDYVQHIRVAFLFVASDLPLFEGRRVGVE
jgi:hypothetical protein